MRLLLFLFALVAFSSCNINSYIMLKNNRKYEFDTPLREEKEYKISENDIITFRLLTEDGFMLVDAKMSGQGGGMNNQAMLGQGGGGFSFDVEYNGTVKLPLLGYIKLSGLTIRQTEAKLEEEYAKYFNKPYAIVSVTSRRALVFNGEGSDAKVVPLSFNNTTLMEVLALSGGISKNGRANKIKLIRKVNDKTEVYRIDLSKIEGLDDADLAIQAGDIIYVEPRRNYVTQVLAEISPYLSLIATAVGTVALARSLNR